MGDIQTVLTCWGVWAREKELEFIIRHYVYG